MNYIFKSLLFQGYHASWSYLFHSSSVGIHRLHKNTLRNIYKMADRTKCIRKNNIVHCSLQTWLFCVCNGCVVKAQWVVWSLQVCYGLIYSWNALFLWQLYWFACGLNTYRHGRNSTVQNKLHTAPLPRPLNHSLPLGTVAKGFPTRADTAIHRASTREITQ